MSDHFGAAQIEKAYPEPRINPPTPEMIEAREKAEAQQREWCDGEVAEAKAAIERQLRAAALEGALRSPSVANGAEVLQVASDYLAFLKGG